MVLGRHRWLVFGLPVLAALMALAASYAVPVQYKSSVIIAVSKDASAPRLKSIVESDQLRDKMIERFRLAERYGTPPGIATQLAFQGRVAATPGREGTLHVAVVDGEPAFAAKLADAVAAEAIRSAHEAHLSAASQQLARVQAKLDQLTEDYKAGEQRLAQMGIKDWQAALPDAERMALAMLGGLQAEVNTMEGGPGARESAQSSLLFLQDRLSALYRQVAERRSTGTANLTPAAFDALKDQYYYFALRKRLEQQAGLAKADLAVELKTVAPASLPLTKDSPKRALIILGAFGAGLGLALLLVYLREGSGNGPSQAERAERMRQLRQAWGRSDSRR